MPILGAAAIALAKLPPEIQEPIRRHVDSRATLTVETAGSLALVWGAARGLTETQYWELTQLIKVFKE